MKLITHRQQQIYDCYYKNECNTKKTADEIGITDTSIKKALFYCAKKGKPVTPDAFNECLPAGFGVTKTTIQRRLNKETGRILNSCLNI